MLRYRTQGILAAGLGFAAIACSDVTNQTDLRPDGEPALLAVLTQSQVDLVEDAVFCRYIGDKLDPEAPNFVGDINNGIARLVCPVDRADFDPPGAQNFGWGIRLMFDELLEADRVETLNCDRDGDGVDDVPRVCEGSLDTTQPITIQCGPTGAQVTLDYTGYYVPNGNNVTIPVGPSIFALPDQAAIAGFATGTPCNVTIDPDVVVDKDGIQPDVLSVPFNFAELALLSVEPSDGNGIVIQPTGAAEFIFNAALDDATLDPATEIELTTAAGAPVPYSAEVDDFNATLDAIYVFPTGTWRPGDYIAKIRAGASFTELNGGTVTFPTEQKTAFSVAFGRIGASPASGGILPPTGGSITIYLNDSLKPETVTADDFELVDPSNAIVPFGVEVITDDLANDAIEVTPTAPLMATTGSQRYNLRVKAASVFTSVGDKNLRGPFTLAYRVVAP